MYSIKVEWCENVGIGTIVLKGRNGFDLVSRSYRSKKQAVDTARNVAKRLGVKFRGVD